MAPPSGDIDGRDRTRHALPVKITLALVGVAFALSAACGRTATQPKTDEAPKQAAASAKPFERPDGCRMIPNRWNDGNSFHVRVAAGREIVARN